MRNLLLLLLHLLLLLLLLRYNYLIATGIQYLMHLMLIRLMHYHLLLLLLLLLLLNLQRYNLWLSSRWIGTCCTFSELLLQGINTSLLCLRFCCELPVLENELLQAHFKFVDFPLLRIIVDHCRSIVHRSLLADHL